MPEPQAPESRQELWSEAVGLAEAEQGLRPPFRPYQFSNGTQFGDSEKPYGPLERN